MLLDFLTTKYRTHVDDGWGALEMGNTEKARDHFQQVLDQAKHDPHMTVFDLAEAHDGMGAVAFHHQDYSEAARWYKEAQYELDEYYRGAYPKKLQWHSYHDRSLMRTILGVAHCLFAQGNNAQALKSYELLISLNEGDELGAEEYVQAIHANHTFQSI